jgi:sec-independent protein translocase protein TatC
MKQKIKLLISLTFGLLIYISYKITLFFIDYIILSSDKFNINLITLSPQETLLMIIYIFLMILFFISIPLLIIIFSQYFKDALYLKERKIIKVFYFTYLLFPIGCFFGLYITNNIFIPYLITFNKWFGLNNTMTLYNYVTFCFNNMLIFGFMALIPVVIKYLIKYNIIQKKQILRYNKHIFILILIFSAIISPPDILSLFIISIPLYLCFIIGLI